MRASTEKLMMMNLQGKLPYGVRGYMPKEEVYEVLKALTGQDFGYDHKEWRDWLGAHKYDGEAWRLAFKKVIKS